MLRGGPRGGERQPDGGHRQDHGPPGRPACADSDPALSGAQPPGPGDRGGHTGGPAGPSQPALPGFYAA